MVMLIESPAEGLVATFFEMAQNRGFLSIDKGNKRRSDLEQELRNDIDDLIGKGIFRVRSKERAETQTQLLKLREATLARPSECRVLKVLRQRERPDFTQDAEVSNQTLDGFTICFACMFTRQGLYDTHYIESLNALRHIVAKGLKGLGHVVHDSSLADTPARSYWARQEEWSCLARANGEHFSRIMISVTKAAESRLAS